MWVDKHGVKQKRWDIRVSVNGVRQPAASFDNHLDAQRFLARHEAEKTLGLAKNVAAGRQKLRDWAEVWLTTKNYEDPATRQNVERRVRKHIVGRLGDMAITEISSAVVMVWLSQLPLAESTKSVIFVHLREILDLAVDEDLIQRNPCNHRQVKIVRPKQQIRAIETKDIWTPGQLVKLQQCLPDRYSIVVLLGATLGLRISEILALSPDDIDTENSVVHVRHQLKRMPNINEYVFSRPKYNKVRKVPVPGGLVEQLNAYSAAHPPQRVTLPWRDTNPSSVRRRGKPRTGECRPGDPVTLRLLITSTEGTRVSSHYFRQKVWNRALRRADISLLPYESGPHALRHNFATVMFSLGYLDTEVALMLGHANANFTKATYIHFINEHPDTNLRQRRLEAYYSTLMDGVAASTHAGSENRTLTGPRPSAGTTRESQ